MIKIVVTGGSGRFVRITKYKSKHKILFQKKSLTY